MSFAPRFAPVTYTCSTLPRALTFASAAAGMNTMASASRATDVLLIRLELYGSVQMGDEVNVGYD